MRRIVDGAPAELLLGLSAGCINDDGQVPTFEVDAFWSMPLEYGPKRSRSTQKGMSGSAAAWRGEAAAGEVVDAAGAARHRPRQKLWTATSSSSHAMAST